MNKAIIIIYGSCYGTTKKYAEELSGRLDCEAVSYENVSDISDKSVCIVTVGLADPKNKENTDNIRKKVKTQVSEELFNKAKIFHLRGGIDYSKLNFLHKKMMGMVYKKAVSVPVEERNAELSAMIETYNKQADFVDFDSLDPIVQSL